MSNPLKSISTKNKYRIRPLKKVNLTPWGSVKRRYIYKVSKASPVVNGLFDTDDLAGCSLLGADNWNAAKMAVADFADGVINGRFYVLPTIISCPDSSAAGRIFGFNENYARSLGDSFYNNEWKGIKTFAGAMLGANPLSWIQENIFDSSIGNVVKEGGHIASNVLAKTPLGGWINIGRDTNDWMSNIWDMLAGKKKSEETSTAVKAGLGVGGILLIGGVGFGIYYLLKDNKKKRR